MAAVVQTSKREFKEIPIDLIKSPEKPSREVFEGIKVLAATIENHGLLEPIVVRKLKDQYAFQLICGAFLRALRENSK